MAAGAGTTFPDSFPREFPLRDQEAALRPTEGRGLTVPQSAVVLRDAQYLIKHFDLNVTSPTDPAGSVVDDTRVEHPEYMKHKMRIDRQGFNNDEHGDRFARYALQAGGYTYASILVRCDTPFSANLHRHAFLQSMYRKSNIWLGRQ
jgi:hypothetical protein